ncbi:MAG: 4-(cytidine 5'-diphospho)-2-C-methyl-D-erythritol kinase [archaeon]
MRLTLKAHAKVNLTLHVLGKRDDGYHNIESVMVPVELADIVTAETSGRDEIISGIKGNICAKALQEMRKHFAFGPVRITIEKNIPVGAGLGGGSADAAAAILGINRLFSLNATQQKLMEIGSSVGMDVPFCIRRKASLATGRGDKLAGIELPEMTMVIANPGIHVSTAEAYAAVAFSQARGFPDHPDIEDVAASLHNDFEAMVEKAYPEIAKIKNAMLKAGALGAGMSGSGPTVFAICRTDAEKVCSALSGCQFTCITKTRR